MFSPPPQRLRAARLWLAGTLTAACGLALWFFPIGNSWVYASYDYLFLFTGRSITNNVTIISMDEGSYQDLRQNRNEIWDRKLHAQLLNRLADDRCGLVAFDVRFGGTTDEASDRALRESLARLSNVVILAKLAGGELSPDRDKDGYASARPVMPEEMFVTAARTNWGVGWFDSFPDAVVRKHWPFPSPGALPGFAWVAAQLAGAKLDDTPRERWLRYYEPKTAWNTIPYAQVANVTNSFRDNIVFIGSKPETPSPGDEDDEFSNPFTRWTGHSVGGVEINATAFLNLLNHEWLERPPAWIEASAFVIIGGALGAGLRCCRRRVAIGVAILVAVLALVGGAALTQFTNYWFPWFIVAGAQAPLALVLALRPKPRETEDTPTIRISTAPSPSKLTAEGEPVLETPDYERIEPHFAKGAYGKVWLVRDAVGQWQALKAVYRTRFEDDAPFEREFRGIELYKPISRKHRGLLCVDFVSRIKPEGYFYYVMELGDSANPDWQKNPQSYKPLDLTALAARQPNGRLAPRDCAGIAAKLCEPLEFLHTQGRTHRDIKPGNIIFVNGEPKLADVGLVGDAQRPEEQLTWVGTPGFMPPDPEPPGTVQADIYALGMVLYVVSTGKKPAVFPDLTATLVDQKKNPEFSPLSEVIFKACHPDRAQRFASAAELRAALQALP